MGLDPFYTGNKTYESVPALRGGWSLSRCHLSLTRDSIVYLVRMSSVSEAAVEDSARHLHENVLLMQFFRKAMTLKFMATVCTYLCHLH